MFGYVLAFLFIAATAPARAEGVSPPPVGAAKCIAFGNMLEDARHRSRDNENFTIEHPDEILRYIEYATHDLELLKPVGGWSSAPSDLEQVRSAIATLGMDFKPKQWTPEPGEAMAVYYDDFDLDNDPDLAFERGDPKAPCSRYEFWRGDSITGALFSMPGPEGWNACETASPSRDEGRFIVKLHGEIAVPVLVRGKGLGADFFIYGLKQLPPSDADAPQQMASKATSAARGLSPFCRIRLERTVEVTVKGPELCGRFSKQVHDALYNRFYEVGGPVAGMLAVLQTRGARLETAWRAIPVSSRAEEAKASLQDLGLSAEQADRLLAAMPPDTSRLWSSPRPDDGQPVFVLAQGRGSSDRMRTALLRMTPDGVTVSEVPRSLSPSEESGVSYAPLSYEGLPLLLELYPSGSTIDIGLTSLDPIERLCLLEVRDEDMTARIDYQPNIP
jgi:hypothetical protein